MSKPIRHSYSLLLTLRATATATLALLSVVDGFFDSIFMFKYSAWHGDMFKKGTSDGILGNNAVVKGRVRQRRLGFRTT